VARTLTVLEPTPIAAYPWRRYPVGIPVIAVGWLAIYTHLGVVARWLVLQVPGLDAESRLAKALEFFLADAPKVLLLLVAVVFGVGVLRSFATPQRTRRWLAGRREGVGNALAAGLGVVTPFCSCSAVPLFIGFVQSGIPLGVTLSFLIAAPLVNEVAVALLAASFGARIAALYVVTGLSIAVGAGWVIGRLHLERWVEPWVWERPPGADAAEVGRSWGRRFDLGVLAVRDVVGRVWPYVIAAIAVGAAIHGYVPTDALGRLLGRHHWWSVPAAVVAGVPLYANAAGVIPVLQALIEKGIPLGTALAFVMAVVALSFPEFVILRRVLRLPLIVTFVGIVTAGIVVVGYLFNALLH
jgi:uncharacterized protein